ncbi:MAG: sugar phosphate nucleotidyltransferase [Balneolaceae bacterium]|nr:sugar phosphate nucleotidyltransferase [Balneolaceae bacterium]MDR9446396.1 sugar phosphate nucleotidyltransferase [Balneolaceae bacterium]
MKLIIPMAGRGTRVRPHSHTTPKPLLPVAGTMIVERIVETFGRTLDRSIDEIVYILGPDFGQPIRDTLTEMSHRQHAKATFKVQDVALGTAHAVLCAEETLEGEVIIVFADTLFDTATKVTLDDADSVIWLKEVEDPSRFGVAVHEGDTITDFVEKPSEPISNQAIIGVYYFKEATQLRKEIEYLMEHNITGHGDEYQLTDALDRMLKQGLVFKKATVDEWLDCGTLPAWLDTSSVILAKEHTEEYAEQHEAHDEKTQDASNYPGSTLLPPVYIGEGVTIENSTVGPNVSLEAGATVRGSTLRDSIIQQKATLEQASLAHSSIGQHAHVQHFEGELHVGDHSKIEGNSDLEA